MEKSSDYPKVLYRYEVEKFWRDEDTYVTKLTLREYSVVKTTLRGVWINPSTCFFKMTNKWVSLSSKKRYAYPTKEEAFNSLVIRNRKRIQYLERDLDFAKDGKILIENFDKSQLK